MGVKHGTATTEFFACWTTIETVLWAAFYSGKTAQERDEVLKAGGLWFKWRFHKSKCHYCGNTGLPGACQVVFPSERDLCTFMPSREVSCQVWYCSYFPGLTHLPKMLEAWFHPLFSPTLYVRASSSSLGWYQRPWQLRDIWPLYEPTQG